MEVEIFALDTAIVEVEFKKKNYMINHYYKFYISYFNAL